MLGATPFQLAFSYLGTTDYSSYLAMADAIAFRAGLGEDSILSYMRTLAVEGGRVLAERWGTDKLVDDSLIGAMVNVRLPTTNATTAAALPRLLLERKGTWVPTFQAPGTGGWWTRVSAQIYTELADFEFLAAAVRDLIAELE